MSRRRVAGIVGSSRNAFDTVAGATPAARATVRIVMSPLVATGLMVADGAGPSRRRTPSALASEFPLHAAEGREAERRIAVHFLVAFIQQVLETGLEREAIVDLPGAVDADDRV